MKNLDFLNNSHERLILGDNAIYSSNSNITGLNNNVIVMGSSGCGKTMSILEPRLLDSEEDSLVVKVSKRNIVDKYKPVFEQRGYRVEDLNYAHPMKSTITYDPLQYIKGYADITYLAESLVKSDPQKQYSNADPYWDESAISLLCGIITLVLTQKGDESTFADVLDMIDRLKINETSPSISTTLDNEFDSLELVAPDHFAITSWNVFRCLPYRTAACVLGTLRASISSMFSPEMKEMFRINNKLDFNTFNDRKTILFVTSSAVNPSLDCFINMFFGQLFKELFEIAESLPNYRLRKRVHVLCDDFANGSRILNFPEYISIFREKGVSVTLLIQSESQLEAMYGSRDSTTIINNCDTYVYMGGMDMSTARSISIRADIPIQDALALAPGTMYIFRRGAYPVKTDRYPILTDSRYIELFERDI